MCAGNGHGLIVEAGGAVAGSRHHHGNNGLGIHQRLIDGAVLGNQLLIVGTEGGRVARGRGSLHDNLAIFNGQRLRQLLRDHGRRHDNLRLLLVDLQLVHGDVIPTALVIFNPDTDILRIDRLRKVHRLNGGGGRGQLLGKGRLGVPGLPIGGGLNMPLDGVIVLPVDHHALHLAHDAQVEGDGGVADVLVCCPAGGLICLVAVPRLVGGEVCTAFHVGGRSCHAVEPRQVGAGLHLLWVGALGHLAVDFKLVDADIIPILV